MIMVVTMAKKKKGKQEETKAFGYSVELTGLILILIGLIGFGFGPAGALIKKFAMFLLGEWWPIVLLLVLIMGIFMLTKRKLPNFLSSKLIGIYIFVIVILIISHFSFITNCENASDIFQSTIDNYMSRVASINQVDAFASSGNASITIGGGIIGAFFSFLSSSLFGSTGTYIILTFLSLFSAILIFDLNLGNLFGKIVEKLKRNKNKDDDPEVIEPAPGLVFDYAGEVDDRKIITSLDDLKPKEKTTDPLEQTQFIPVQNSTADYKLPTLDLLDDPGKMKKASSNFLLKNKEALERVLKEFQIEAKVVDIHEGPAVTQYELVVPAGMKLTRIVSINKEISLSLAATDIRIQAPIPGKNTVGIEIPNPSVSPVRIKEILSNVPKKDENANILVALGKDIMGRANLADLSKMPHLLVAGSTGSGKSVCINSIISSILLRYRPDEVKIMLVDPKKVELSNYNGVPHLMCPVVTDPKKASIALQKLVQEMEKRYETFADVGVKNITGYNELVEKKKPGMSKMYYIVAIIDELADLMLVASKEVEDSIMRITQMARAAGIHLIVATQRPSTDVITGVVKANIPSRLSFAVASNVDSRTILDQSGAEKLLGKGDMLYLPMGANIATRIQGCFISEEEIERVINYVCDQQKAQYVDTMENLERSTSSASGTGTESGDDDPLYDEIVEFAIKTGKVSASLLQRRFRLGYNRAARIVDLLEERGIIGPANGSKPRDVLVKLEGSNEEGEG